MTQPPRTGRLFLLLLLLAVGGATAPWAEDTATAAPSCAAARALADTGRIPAAEETYAKALEEPVTEGCAAAGLKRLDEPAGPLLDKAMSPCAAANALDEAGRDAEAQAAYEKVLEKRPGSECAKEGVKAPEEHFWDDPKGAGEDLLAWLGLIAVGLGLIAAVVALWLLLMTRIPGLRSLPPASRVRAVRLGIDSFEDNSTPSQGGTLAALARSKMESFGAGNSHMRMVDSRAAAEETIWTKLGAINDQAKGVSAAIEAIGFFYPRRQFQATGILQADSGKGPGLSLSVRRKQSIVGATTLWAQSFGLEEGKEGKETVDRLQKLAIPAAAWISHVTLTAAGETPGGAQDPVSWALFKAGGEWERDGNSEKAAALYKAATELDPSNWGAVGQLGKLEGEKHNYREAAKLLRAALQTLEGKGTAVKTPPPGKNPDWYRLKYRLASTLTNGAYVNKSGYADAEKEIDELLAACWPWLKPSPLDLLLKRDEDVREFVTKTVQYAALDLKALIALGLDEGRAGVNEGLGLPEVRRRLRRKEPITPLTIVEAVLQSKNDPTALLLLDIACFFQLSGDARRAKQLADEAFAKYPPSKEKQLRARAAEDPMLKTIPGIVSAKQPEEKRRCQWPKRDAGEPEKPVRTWF